MNQIEAVAKQLQISEAQVQTTLTLLEEGNTVPFIARYRKEMTKGLDEEQIRELSEMYNYQVQLEKRKEDVLRLIEEKGKLTDAIVAEIKEATKLSQVEDIYRPYKQKKKTRAGLAIAAGLEPLANLFLKLPRTLQDDEILAYACEAYPDKETLIQGAKDIIAEKITDKQNVRNKIYDSMANYGKLVTKIKKDAEDEKKVYQMYYAFEGRVSSLQPHNVMAIDRAEKEKVISVNIEINEEYIQNWLFTRFAKWEQSATVDYVKEAILDGCKRLAFPSIERMVRSELSEKAHDASIDVFSLNLEKLLLQPPMKNKTILGFDPAFRTGCKLAVVNDTGKMETIAVIYPHQPVNKVKEATKTLVDLVKKYNIDLIAIGNGTASRESERFVSQVIKDYNLPVAFTLVSEAGASVYSASKLAIEEFPKLHVEERSAISIARRLLDPLSELIKIDPQSIGVGQYQHDLPVSKLKERLNFVVEKAVNLVGVNINQASATLLSNVAGLTLASAKSIVEYREKEGPILSRTQIKKIPKIGPKAFEQAAGFLRIEDGKQPLDRTAIHPESYDVAKKVLKELQLEVSDMGTDKAKEAIQNCNRTALATTVETDAYTLDDILDAITMPLRDYRDKYDAPLLRQDVLSFEDIKVGDVFEGVVRNVVDFGAFVDIGLKEDGLVHISQLSERRINHPSDVVSVGDIIKVWVYKKDEEKHKVQLTIRGK